jgi:hypothetical protein
MFRLSENGTAAAEPERPILFAFPGVPLPIAVSLQSRLAGATVTAIRLAQDANGTVVHAPATLTYTSTPTRTALILRSGVNNILRCDSGDVVSGIVSFVLSQRKSLRLAAAVLDRTRQTLVADAVMLLNGMRCFVCIHPPSTGGGAVTVARLANEQKAIAELMRLAPDHSWTELVFDARLQSVTAALPDLLRTAATWRQIARISRIVSRRHDAFRAYRVVELLFYYQRYVRLFATHPFQMAVISSHSNPHGIAFNLAARRFGVPSVLITHGMPISPIARLDYDLAIMECEASADIYRRAGCRLGRVLVKSRKRDYLAMATCQSLDAPLAIGVFLSKDPAEDQFVSLVRALLSHQTVTRILVRPHPANLWPRLSGCLASMEDERLQLSTGGPILDDVRACDFVMAGNSTVHVEAVVAGKPACYVRGLDHAPYDTQSFVHDRLVYEFDRAKPFDPLEVWQFYARDEWPTILRRYANIDQDEADLARIVSAAVSGLAAVHAS